MVPERASGAHAAGHRQGLSFLYLEIDWKLEWWGGLLSALFFLWILAPELGGAKCFGQCAALRRARLGKGHSFSRADKN